MSPCRMAYGMKPSSHASASVLVSSGSGAGASARGCFVVRKATDAAARAANFLFMGLQVHIDADADRARLQDAHLDAVRNIERVAHEPASCVCALVSNVASEDPIRHSAMIQLGVQIHRAIRR